MIFKEVLCSQNKDEAIEWIDPAVFYNFVDRDHAFNQYYRFLEFIKTALHNASYKFMPNTEITTSREE